MTGVTHPSGSNICDEVCSTSRLVTNVLTGGICLVARERVSVNVFQRKPKSPTVELVSLVLSDLVISLSLLLFVDHDLKLNLAWPMMSRDWV